VKLNSTLVILMKRILLALAALVLTTSAYALDTATQAFRQFLDDFERQNLAYEWRDTGLRDVPWQYHRLSRQDRPLMFAHFGESEKDCTLLLGAVHGDELPTVLVLLRLTRHIQINPDFYRNQCIVVAPLVNPDGFFAKPPQRANAGGVDVNRNLPTKDWSVRAHRAWNAKGNGNKRYFPGKRAASEPETLFQMALIKRFKPKKILSLHSPLGIYDFDGASTSLDSFEKWLDAISKETQYPLKRLGYYPGSLGNYAGLERAIFTLTLELPTSAPEKGLEYFQKFLPAIQKFLNLKISDQKPYRIIQ